ncbi:hypothetical protein TNIN_172821 [Trichonephila inaurata madagascariensis]|uniref:Uncharacterized protein n=1 Tax=Trichonephila inaurata madagascariensis TaxID=2747483 RepID=A0A8X6MAG8_9ARAC|nr:hypothetical protein TNIN_172821 [Trichonephila inaurata madagascariensis]
MGFNSGKIYVSVGAKRPDDVRPFRSRPLFDEMATAVAPGTAGDVITTAKRTRSRKTTLRLTIQLDVANEDGKCQAVLVFNDLRQFKDSTSC